MNDNPESESESESDEPKGGRPGPVDKSGSGGMATREIEAEESDSGE